MNLFSKPLDFSPYFQRVVAWNATARSGVHDFSDSVDAFQLTLIEEEAGELTEAYDDNDKVLALDALCDTFVVASYKYFLEVGDPNWIPEIFIPVPNKNIDYAEQLKFSWQVLKSGKASVRDACALLYQFDGCVTKALDEVMNSNDSKFPLVINHKGDEVFLHSNGTEMDPVVECRQIEARSEGRYTGVTYSIVGEGDDRRFVFKSDKGKIVKPCSFFEPNLAQFC